MHSCSIALPVYFTNTVFLNVLMNTVFLDLTHNNFEKSLVEFPSSQKEHSLTFVVQKLCNA